MKILSTITILSLLLFSSACKKDSEAEVVFSCDYPSASQCIDLDDSYGETLATSICATLTGTLSTTSACSSTSRVGQCERTSDGYTNSYSYYSTGDFPFDATTAEAACAANSGTFTPASFEEIE